MESPENVAVQIEGDRKAAPTGIGGWLIIPAIIIVLASIGVLYSLLIDLWMIKSHAPDLLSDARLWLSVFIDVNKVFFAVIVAFLFFKKLRIAMSAYIGFLAALPAANLFQFLLLASMYKEAYFVQFKPFLGSCVLATIWIPYFLKSKRVKNTFVN